MSQLLTDANVTFWLRSGNLLSLVRNSSYTLENDDDVDFGVLGSDDQKVLALQDRVKADGHTLMVLGRQLLSHTHILSCPVVLSQTLLLDPWS